MNRQILIGAVVIFVLGGTLYAEQPEYKQGVVLVRFANDPNKTVKNSILNSVLGSSGSPVKSEYKLVQGLTLVSLPAGVSVENALASLKQSSSIMYAGPDYVSHAFAVPNDSRFSDLWGMRNTGQAGGTSGADIDAPGAWDISTGNGTIIVAVTDTGVDYTHSDLAANMWTDANGAHGYDFVNNDNDPMDDYGHGTHVAGTIGAVGNNGLGVAGVCWHTKIMALKVLDANGMGYLSDSISAVQYAVSNGARVINASWGYSLGVPFSYLQPLYDAIAAARDVNVIFVAAAGNNINNNNDASPAYPASFDLDNVISVMATTNTDVQAYYSNYGLMSVDLGAPGGDGYPYGPEDILSTIPGGGYDYKAGTSMASPHVAGACALLLSIDSTLTASQVKQILLDTVDKTLPGLCVSGGRLNLAAAAQEAQHDTTPPTPDTAGWLMPPTATGLHTIAMEAQNEIDRSDVEYYFECVDDNTINSGWEPNALFVFKDPGELKIKHATTYGFRVKSRDKSENHNETAWSNTLYATTAAVSDNLPPAPSPAQWVIQPRLIRPTPLILRMKIKGKGTDENGEQFRYKYYDTLTPGTVIDSNWKPSADGTMPDITSGIQLNHTYVFNCKVKDNLGNETGWSEPNVSVTLTTATGPRILRVPSQYTTIQAAINAANNGDIVEVSPYPVFPYYYRGIGFRNLEGNIDLRFNGKAITVRSTDPENPDVVARTIIDCDGEPDFNEPNRAFIFDHGEGINSILAGFTIRNAYVKAHPGRDGDVNLTDINGMPGRTAAGGAILCGPNPDPCNILGLPNWGTGTGSPTIRNCVFINCDVNGGDGGLGADGNDGNDFDNSDPCVPPVQARPGKPGGWGGDSGSALGGAIYCSSGSNPVIKDCTIIGCSALSGLPGNGGNGGDGGNDPNLGQKPGGNAGNGGDVNLVVGAAGGGICAVPGSNPQIIGCDINDCDANIVTYWGLPGLPGNGVPNGQPGRVGGDGPSFGGGVYYAVGNAAVNISSTTFTRNNIADDVEGGIYEDAYGGGIFLDAYGTGTTTMSDCNLTGNSADTSGAGIGYSYNGKLVLRNCSLSGNSARLDGGGLSGWFNGVGTLEVYDSDIRGNTAGAGTNAGYGGGLYLENTTLTIEDSQLQNNRAQDGGAIAGINCQVDIHNSNITGNKAVTPSGLGGGFAFWNSYGAVTDCIMKDNSADEYGGAVFMEGWTTQPLTFTNCLITDNIANFEGGGLSNNVGAWMQLHNCTVAYNSATNPVYSAGGGVSDAEYFAWVEIEDSILWGNSAAHGQQIAVGSIFGSSPDPGGPFADVDVSYSDVEGGEGQVFLENPAYTAVWWMYGSFNADPLFADSDVNEQTYYLSQISAGQLTNSPCVDAGDISASNLESAVDPTLNTHLTTRTDLVEDIGAVDLGYHYKTGTPGQYQLTTEVYDTGHGRNGRLNAKSDGDHPFDFNDPNTRSVIQGTEVNLTAVPDPCYKVWYWSGTDDDSSTSLTNTVTMNTNKKVIVAFQPDNNMYYLTVTIIGQGTVTIDPNKPLYNLNEVVNLTAVPANPSDAVSWTGTDDDYSEAKTNTVTMTGHKNVTVRFYSPRILYVGGDANYPTIQQAVNDACDGDIVMLTPGTYILAERPSGTSATGTIGWDYPYLLINKDITLTSTTPENPAATSIIARIDVWNVTRHCVIQGLTIRDTTYWGPDLFDPNGEWIEGTPIGSGLDGAPGPDTFGAGITLNGRASPTVRYCIFSNCVARGIHGGNGNAGLDALGWGGNGGPGGKAHGGGAYCGQRSDPLFKNCQFSGCVARGGDGGNGASGSNPPGHGGAWGDKNADWWWEYPSFYGIAIEDFWRYSGYGGAVFCDDESTAEFIDCSFSNNIAIGGSCGISGNNPFVPGWPYTHYKIQSFGGAVYASSGSAPTFTGCSFINNTADIDGWPTHLDGGATVAAYPTISYGGAVAFENGASPIFTNCLFQQNLATVGGAMYQDESFPLIIDSNFIANSALHGGAILFSQGVSQIKECNFIGNEATFDAAQGGAITALGANIEVVDSNITNNRSAGSGGGIYLSSKNIDGNEFAGGNSILIKNCLITYNSAEVGGGGIAANWHSDPNVVNCTIFNNKVGGAGLGGGLLSAYGSFINVINDIIWGNEGGFGSRGAQIAANSGPGIPSSIRVTYSDVQDSNDPNVLIIDINALDVVFCLDTTGSMFDDLNAVKLSARQITDSITSKFADFRIALATYRDFPDSNYGAPGDWPYRDEVRFTTDANRIINGLQPLQANGGADGPESVYAGLMHCIDANALVARLASNYQERFIEVNSPGLGNWRKGGNVLRIILLMGDAPPHDPEPYTNYVLNDVVAAADGENQVHVMPVLIGNDPEAANYFRAIATNTGGAVVQAPDANAVVGAFLDAINMFLQISPPIFIDANSTINWDPNTFAWLPGSHNINADPCFIAGYFLSQILAGQPVTSPCVDTGSAEANSPDINLVGYTTRTDSGPDAGIVDMGYHYPLFVPTLYRLDFNAVEGNGLSAGDITPGSGLFNWYTTVPLHVIIEPPTGYQMLWTGTDDDNDSGGDNTVLMDRNKKVTVAFVKNVCDLTVQVIGMGGTVGVIPPSGTYPRGSKVTLIAYPAEGYRVQRWTGTDNDNSFAATNTVTMNGDKYVTVEFGVPKTLSVPGNFTTIQAAVNAARDGDIISISSGVYNTPNLVINREVTVTSTNPDDPCVVAMTVIDGNGIASIGVYFGAGTTPKTVFDGITIANMGYGQVPTDDGANPGDNGTDGSSSQAGGMFIAGSPTIKNCVIRNCNIFGGNAGNGAAAGPTTDIPAGHGGWGGWARGGGIYIYSNASPTIINTTITNCSVTGGNGGNGGSFVDGGGDAGNGGNWSDGLLWRTWGYIGDYRYYSGYGGGVYCDSNSYPEFNSCNITYNTARGGMSGIGGNRAAGVQIPMPDTAYRIPSYGGGVYCAENSHATFLDCNITGNSAPKPDSTYHADPYLGHGGGVAFDKTSFVRFENCNINDNNAAVGGGMFWAGEEDDVIRATVIDGEISGNSAYIGGGIYGTYTAGQLKGCTLYNNFAGVRSDDVDAIVGQGGGIFGAAMSTTIEDCFLSENVADASGGGIYVFGPGDDTARIKNCLFAGNEAGRDGGGVSTNWGAITSVEDCTFYGNLATATFGDPSRRGFGGGLYCSYGATADINNSIFWNDDAPVSREISVESGFEFDRHCGTVRVSYSDIEGGQADVNTGTNCTLIWGAGNINSNPLFVDEAAGNFRLKQISAGQKVNSPCVDAGSTLSVYLGLIFYSTSTTGTPDVGQVDMGYHYATYEPCRRADLFTDNSEIINFRDLAVFAQKWMNEACSDANGWCSNTDLTYDGWVDVKDLKAFADCWLEKLVIDTVAPVPNPMTWAILPHATTSTSIEMMATIATDGSGVVEYEFNEATRPALNSGWRADPCYAVGGLDPNGPYCFSVRARDKYGNTTAWSMEECLTQLGDVNAPGPAPFIVRSADVNNISWTDPNTASGQFMYTLYPVDYRWWHRVIADVGGITDDSGGPVELRFICTNSGGLSSINKVKDANGDPAKILLNQPVAIGSREAGWRVTYSGSTIVYDVDVDKVGGSGKKLFWKACVYDAALNANCSDVVEIVWPPIR